MDRDGHILDASLYKDLQPPFLLRYSPQLFAKECPEMFEYDQESGRLSLKEGKEAPRMKRAYLKDPPKKWVYGCD